MAEIRKTSVDWGWLWKFWTMTLVAGKCRCNLKWRKSRLTAIQRPSRTQGQIEQARKAHKSWVKRSKSHSTLDKACQHRLESNEFNSTWHSPSKLWRNRYIKLRSKGAFWQSKLELPISSGSGDMKLQAVWRHYFKSFGDVKRSGDATNRPIMTKFNAWTQKAHQKMRFTHTGSESSQILVKKSN